MEKLLILDTNSLLNRAYYAIRGLTTQDGMPTGAIFGTLKLILDISAKVQPDRIFAAFDITRGIGNQWMRNWLYSLNHLKKF